MRGHQLQASVENLRCIAFDSSPSAEGLMERLSSLGIKPVADLHEAAHDRCGAVIACAESADLSHLARQIKVWRDISSSQWPVWICVHDDASDSLMNSLLEQGATEVTTKAMLPDSIEVEWLTRLFSRNRFIARLDQERATLRSLALRDPLTGLLNRRHFEQDVSRLIKITRRSQEKFALILLDLDNFKLVNDAYGHDSGDQLLLEVAGRINSAVRPEDLVFRLGGDEFAILIGKITAPSTCIQMAGRVLAAVSAPVRLSSVEHLTTASIGLAIWPDCGGDTDEVLRAADLAMYRAKGLGKNRIGLYTPDLREAVQRQATLSRDLRAGIRDGELQLYFQPQACSTRGAIVGVEALLRWRHPTLGLLSPDAFLDVAEAGGLMPDITAWVIRNSCAALQRVLSAQRSVKSLRLALNVSGADLREGGLLVKQLSEGLESSGVPPEHIEIEITEHVLIEDIESARAALNLLVDLGVNIGLDDFGIGYSSLSYLKEFPISVLKIDRTFVRNGTAGSRDQQLLSGILELAAKVGIDTVAEGVETKEQLSIVRDLGASRIQGFLISRPLPEQELIAFLLESQDCAASCTIGRGAARTVCWLRADEEANLHT